ncbi:MAG TPA: ATP synthase F1 subunit epsilon [Chthoniobacteraceae bacterium]|nr:ATP synthase F1 subunit epsilon [Chthoniobacteraceae bacterium]
MAATLRLEIVTPESKAYSDDVELVVLPAVEGEIGVYPMHVPLLTQILPGELVVTKGGQTQHLAVGEGFVEVTGERVNVLVDMAIEERAIDESAAEAAVKRAEEALAKAHELGSEEAAAVQAALAKSLAQLHVKRRRRNV